MAAYCTQIFSTLLPQWGHNRPFVLSENACEITPPVAYNVEKASLFYQQALEVYETSQQLTAEQKEIALFWA